MKWEDLFDGAASASMVTRLIGLIDSIDKSLKSIAESQRKIAAKE